MKYTFHNAGTAYSFNPAKPIYDVRPNSKKQNALEFHVNLVKERNALDTFICDDKGNIIYQSDKPTTHVKANWRKIVKAQKEKGGKA